jgi:hypothetical protein
MPPRLPRRGRGGCAAAGAAMSVAALRRCGAARAAAVALHLALLMEHAAGAGWGRLPLASGAARLRIASDAAGARLCMWLGDGASLAQQPCLPTGLPLPTFAGTCAQLTAFVSAVPSPPVRGTRARARCATSRR